jgi:hypothetical protein
VKEDSGNGDREEEKDVRPAVQAGCSEPGSERRLDGGGSIERTWYERKRAFPRSRHLKMY